MERQKKLLNERYDLSESPGKGRYNVGRKAHSRGRSREAPPRSDLGRARPNDARGNQSEGALAQGVSVFVASESKRKAACFSLSSILKRSKNKKAEI